MYKRSIEDPSGFWSDLASQFYWKQKWGEAVVSENLDIRKCNVKIEWFKGGLTNICYNSLDRNIESGNGDKVALYWEANDLGTDDSLTYSQLLARVSQLANYLKDNGVKKGDAVVIYLPMLMELPMAMLATARIGAVHSVVFAGFSADSLAQRIMDCKPKVVITCNAVKRGSKVINLKDIVDTALAESAKSGISVEACLTYENQSALKRENTKWQEGRDVWWQDIVPNYPTTCEVEWVDAEDPLFLLYTSGSTEKPKGVLHTSGGYMVYSATTFKYAVDYKPSDIYWCTADCGWITGHSYVTYGPMLNGATNVIFEGAPTYPDAGRCWDIVDKFKVTIFCTAPTLVRSLMREGNEYVTRYSRKSLRVLVSVGEPINPSAWRWYFNVVGDSRCPISNTWWQTETGGFMITPLPGAWPQKPGSATFPFCGVQPVIVDEKGVEIEGECSGYLCVKQSWPSAFRTLFGDHERYGTTYFKPFPGYYLLWFFGIAACVKVLLIPSYHSTDFEVHRHWLALTHSLSLSQWYSDQTSPWTLDYPPFFAYFEYFLSFFAHLVDPQIVHMHHGLNYKANTVIYFQGISVILSDLCLLYGVYRLTRNLEFKKRMLMWVLVVWSPGLLIVDHMHFQYNGFLLGLLLLSISYLQEGRDLTGGFLFAVLLCFKHLFAVAAPVYFVYFLRHYCWKGFFRGFGRLSVLGALVVAVFAAAYGPFVYQGQIQHVIHRMFPFGRGLCHAYWAPNFWVFCIMLDKGLAFFLRRLGLNIPVPAASFTGGLVGDSSPFAVLPQITPLTTFIMVLISISPCLINAWKNPQPRLVARWIVYAYTCGFLFGWHVHEKASLHFVIPMTIVAVHSLEDATHYFLLSIASCYSLFPLLYEPQEYPIKVMLLLLHSIVMYYSFSALFPDATPLNVTASVEKRSGDLTKTGSSGAIHKKRGFCMGSLGMCYLFGLLVVEAWGQFLHPYLLGDKLPFVPLLLVSIYTGLAVMYSWMWQLRQILGQKL